MTHNPSPLSSNLNGDTHPLTRNREELVMNTATETDTPIEWIGNRAYIGDALVAITAQSYYGLRIGLWNGADARMGWYDAKIINLDKIRANGDLETIPDDADTDI